MMYQSPACFPNSSRRADRPCHPPQRSPVPGRWRSRQGHQVSESAIREDEGTSFLEVALVACFGEGSVELFIGRAVRQGVDARAAS